MKFNLNLFIFYLFIILINLLINVDAHNENLQNDNLKNQGLKNNQDTDNHQELNKQESQDHQQTNSNNNKLNKKNNDNEDPKLNNVQIIKLKDNSNDDKSKDDNVEFIELNDDNSKEDDALKTDDDLKEYLFIKIKSLAKKDDKEFDSEELELNDYTKVKSSPVKQTISFNLNDDKDNENYQNEDNENSFNKETDKSTIAAKLKDKEIMLSDTYPAIDLLKVNLNKNEFNKKIDEDDEDDEKFIEEELNDKQLLGKQIFEDAIIKLEFDKPQAFKLIDQAAQLGYKEAEDFLLQGLVFGEFNQGLDVLKSRLDYFARKGNSLAQMFYGFFYASGIFFKPSQANALLYYTVSAAANNTYAQMALGYRYWHGINFKRNCKKALKYYRKVAKVVEKRIKKSTIPSGVIERKRLFDENENPTSYTSLNPDMIQYYQVLAENGDTLAQIAIGQIHYQGMRGVPKDHKKGEQNSSFE